MESYGELMRSARERRGLTLEGVERATTISRQYVEALEQEQVEAFPGEPYFIGFLSNYCEFLGLDKDEILSLYHAKKIQEAPTPIALLERHRPKFLVPLILSLIFVALAVTGYILYFRVFQIPQKRAEMRAQSEERQKFHQYTFSGKPETKRLYKGDQILFPAIDGSGNITLIVSNTLGNLTLKTPAGDQIVELSEERELDVDGNGSPDLIIYLSDVSMTDEANGAEIRLLEKKGDSTFIEISDKPEQDGDEIQSMSTVRKSGNRTVIHEDNRAYPFTLTMTFRGPCLFRHKIDRQNYVESYYKNGDVITITANNGIRLWASNINTLKIHVIAGLSSYDLEVGRAGEVQVEDIKWLRDNDGKFRLVVLEVD